MTFRAIRLPIRIAFGAQGGPAFRTVVSTQESGDEAREATVDKGLGRWTISYIGKLEDAWSEFQDFFYIVGGPRDSWMFWDPLDHACSRAQAYLEPIGGDSPPADFQMWKRRTIGAYTYDQKIVLPRTDKTTVDGTGTYSVSATTGVITVVSGANPTGFLCDWFDKLCRFGDDHLVQTIDNKSPRLDEFIVNYAGIPIVEIPLSSA